MTDALFAAFQLASGDNHPVHYDVEYCRARGMPGMLAHGFQVAIQTAAGAGLFPHMVEHSLMGFIEQSSRFLKPVFTGDTLYGALEISELVEQRTTGVLTTTTAGEITTPGDILEPSHYCRRRRAIARCSANRGCR